MKNFEFFLTNTLEKIFPDTRPPSLHSTCFRILSGGRFSLQLVYTASGLENGELLPPFQINAFCQDASIAMNTVELMPSQLPVWPKRDANYLRTQPGLYPDLLLPTDGLITPVDSQYRAIWINVDFPIGFSGKRTLHISATVAENYCFGTGEVLPVNDVKKYNCDFKIDIDVLDICVGEQKLLHTEWLHCDSLASYYNTEVFSEKFWEVVENYISFASKKAGINMILTPIFTPPIDTAKNSERLTVQLIDVTLKDGTYSFCFDKLIKWCEICKRHGITHLELAHLFTQWGAGYAPKIMADVDGKKIKIFGWDTSATSPEYASFLKTLIPQLLAILTEIGYTNETLRFHLSDEPSKEHLENYIKAKDIVKDLLRGYKIMDALNSYEYYQQGIIDNPIPANNYIMPFIENNVPDLWVYYCCAQCIDVPNRFFAMPSARNRVMGMLMYYYDIKGFLHWGYNFYNSRFSTCAINPYLVTDSNMGFESGDPFLVYPAPDGSVYSSIRNEVQMDAFDDIKYLQKLEDLKGRKYVKALIVSLIGYSPTFKKYPLNNDFFDKLRNRLIDELLIN